MINNNVSFILKMAAAKKQPVDKALYNKLKAQAKKKFKVYPSAYANIWLAKQYKDNGGKYVKSKPKK